ncbi:MAG: hypothetical protein ABJC19_09425 [Gemmatimonadota bacterium]
MSTCIPAATPAEPRTRPEVSEVTDSPEGRTFTVSFLPGQQLPTHTNPSRVVITAVHGCGEVLVRERNEVLLAGASLVIEPSEPHAVTAGAEGLELTVLMVPSCCSMC